MIKALKQTVPIVMALCAIVSCGTASGGRGAGTEFAGNAPASGAFSAVTADTGPATGGNQPHMTPDAKEAGGYIPELYFGGNDLPDLVACLPAPPEPGSAGFAYDSARYEWGKSARSDLALAHRVERDAVWDLDTLLAIFSEPFGMELSREKTPRIHKVFVDGISTIEQIRIAPKAHFHRQRPFVRYGDHLLTEWEEADLAGEGSYPSGHTIRGWSAALILAEINPDAAEALFKRGWEYGESRVVAGAHWQSDVDASRPAADIGYSKLQSSPAFRSQMDLARQEYLQLSSGTEVSPVLRDTVVRITLQGASCPFASFADYGVWVPGGEGPLRGVMVFQHGCTMEAFGITKPYDLQYQAFARKWHLAILETAIHGDCHVWAHPESGSAAALMKVLSKAGGKTGHPELATVPWLMWGHSGGGHWTLAMLRDYPGRILAAVSYSAAFDPQWDYPEAAAQVPLLLRHAGAVDEFALCETTARHTFDKLRAMDAPVSIVYNRGENHNLSHLREMMIPFFEAALRERLPRREGEPLRPVRTGRTWLGDTLTLMVFPEKGFKEDKSAMCRFPDKESALAWQEYAIKNEVADKTPPPPPGSVEATACVETSTGERNLTVRWHAEADPESGIDHFNIHVEGVGVFRFPEQGTFQTYDRNGDNTVPPFPPAMEMTVPLPKEGGPSGKIRIEVETVSGHGRLVSRKTGCTVRLPER